MRLEGGFVPYFQDGYVVQHIQLKDFGRIVSIEGPTLIVEVINQAGELRDYGMKCAWRREVCVVNFALTNKFKDYTNLPHKSFIPHVVDRYAVLAGSHKLGKILTEYPDVYSIRLVDKYGSELFSERNCQYLWDKGECFLVNKDELACIKEQYEKPPPKKIKTKPQKKLKQRTTRHTLDPEPATAPIIFKGRSDIVYEKSNYHCVICGIHDPLNKEGKLSVDHIHPISKGGTNELSNLQCMCKTCNHMKGNMYDYDFKMWYRRRYGALWIDDI